MLDGPTSFESFTQAIVRYTLKFCPFGYSLNNAVDFDMTTCAAIASLGLVCCPKAIAGFVMAAVVLALDLHTGRTFAHISQKILKGLPPLADPNATSTVAFIFQITAALQHRAPNRVRCRIFLTAAQPMLLAAT